MSTVISLCDYTGNMVDPWLDESKARANFRSATPIGFARAVYLSNAPARIAS